MAIAYDWRRCPSVEGGVPLPPEDAYGPLSADIGPRLFIEGYPSYDVAGDVDVCADGPSPCMSLVAVGFLFFLMGNMGSKKKK